MLNHHDRLLDDLKRQLCTRNLEEWIEEIAARIAESGITRAGYIELNSAIWTKLDIDTVQDSGSLFGRACIRSGASGYVVHRQRLSNRQVERFALAHEFGHVLFFRPGGQAIPLSSVQKRVGEDVVIEDLCDRFAAALLLPRPRVTDWLVRRGLHVHSPASKLLGVVPALARQFWVGDQVAVRRLFFELADMRYAFAKIRRTRMAVTLPFGDEQKWKEMWRLQWLVLPPTSGESRAKLKLPASKLVSELIQQVIQVDAIDNEEVSLDPRWYTLLNPGPPTDAKSERFETRGVCRGIVVSVDDGVLMGIKMK